MAATKEKISTYTFHQFELAFHACSYHYFNKLQGLTYPIWLDSGDGANACDRYSIMSAQPLALLTSQGTRTQLDWAGQLSECDDSAFKVLKDTYARFCALLPSASHASPFTAGALGYLGYDLAPHAEPVQFRAQRELALPDMALGFYTWAVVIDHYQQHAQLRGFVENSQELTWLTAIAEQLSVEEDLSPPVCDIQSDWQCNMSYADYAQAFAQVKAHLLAGDCYQINLTQRFKTQTVGEDIALYRMLRARNPSPFAGFMRLPQGSVLSLSPERFLQVKQQQVLTQPIKGTRPRDPNPQRDQALADELRDSSKDHAENLMIVDLLRNDISKSCIPGSVKVEKLCELQSFTNVHHLVSTITATLQADKNAIDLLAGAFPGGSITGAPKIRAMQIIDELELTRRHVYCGSLCYIDVNGNMDSNIAIRSLAWQQDQLYAYAGGGIVIDSELANEYQECFDKLSWLLTLPD